MLTPIARRTGSIAKRINPVAAPTAEPISFDMAKSALKMGNINSSPFHIARKVRTARTMVENHLNRRLVQQYFDLFLDDEAYIGTASGSALRIWNDVGFGDHPLGLPEIELPYPPVQSVVGIYTTDNQGEETTVDPETYSVSRGKEPCRIRLNPGYSWPSYRGFEGFRVRFTAGYATPVRLQSDGQQILAMHHGYRNGDMVSFSSHDGTLPEPLEIQERYLIRDLTPFGFGLTDLAGTPIDLTSDTATQWTGTWFLGEVPDPILDALILISGLNQGGEARPRVPGSNRSAPQELPIDPWQLLNSFIWPVL